MPFVLKYVVEVIPPTAAILESMVRSKLPSVMGPAIVRAVDLRVMGAVSVKVPAVMAPVWLSLPIVMPERELEKLVAK